MSIYEVHAPSWRRGADGDFPSWDELAATLPAYAADLGFTHVELMPISEHPFDGSWGYQTLGLYAPSARFGPPEGFARFVARLPCARASACCSTGCRRIFPSDAHGLAQFDGTRAVRVRRSARRLPPRLEHADLQLRPQRSAQFPGRQCAVLDRALRRRRPARRCGGLDALPRLLAHGRRVDCRMPAGGRENLEAISLLQRINEAVGADAPGAITLAEESTAFPGVSARRPTPAAWASTTSGTWAG